MIKLVIHGNPATKKNSMQICQNKRTGATFIAPSKAFERYKKVFLRQVKKPKEPINEAVNVKAVYYRKTRHRVDLSNLINATHDLLVDSGVLLDDNCRIIKSVDGSEVRFDKDDPRVEITITKKEG